MDIEDQNVPEEIEVCRRDENVNIFLRTKS